MVFDLNKCMGCQTCSVACKMVWTGEPGEEQQWWCSVNTQPGLGTPKGWESMGGGYDAEGRPVLGKIPTAEDFGGGWQFNHEDVFFGGKGASVHLAPSERVGECGGAGSAPSERADERGHVGAAPSWGPNWDEDQGGGEYPNSYFFYLPRLCNHCTRPVCVEVCPSGAMYKREQDGVVLRDESVCRGSRACMAACPYKKIYFNHVRNVAQHCNLCFPRLEQGVAPICARQCPGRLVFVGLLDDEEGPIHKLVHEWAVALPLHPEYGTEPNIFYIPPLSPHPLADDLSIDYQRPRIPSAYLESLFGPKVHAALDKLHGELAAVRAGGKSEILDTLIVYRWQQLFGPFTRPPARVGGALREVKP